jgi:hypothetical protein
MHFSSWSATQYLQACSAREGCTGRRSPEAALYRAVDGLISTGIFDPLLFALAVPLNTLRVDFALHPRQQLFRGLRRNAGPLKVLDFLPLPHERAAHPLDLVSDVMNVRHT